MTPPERREDEDGRRSWREGPQGGPPSQSPDDFHVPYMREPGAGRWRESGEGPEASPDDFDTRAEDTDQQSEEQTMPQELHRELQEKLGDSYEVIFEIEGLQIRRMGDRAFIAEFIPDENILRAGPHVMFHDREDEDPDKLRQEGQERLEKPLSEWKAFGFEPIEEAHLMTMETAKNNVMKTDVPRYIQPMGKKVSSVDDAAEAVRWVRKHRKFD